MTQEIVENSLPNSFKKLHERITIILRENCDANDLNVMARREKKKLNAFTKVLHKVQTNLLTTNKHPHEIRDMILGMK